MHARRRPTRGRRWGSASLAAAVFVALLGAVTTASAHPDRRASHDVFDDPVKWFVDPDSNAARQAAAWLQDRPADAATMARLAERSQADWFVGGRVDVRSAARARVERAQGFFLNVSNFQFTSDLIAYGHAVSDLIGARGGTQFVIDTSRNGLGPWDPTVVDNWCNPPDRALGLAATTDTGDRLVDAFLWVKRPGESDGTCRGGPLAGVWWPEYALGLAQRAGL
jgi:hypothetical protein